MPKRLSHSSQKFKVIESDGKFSLRRIGQGPGLNSRRPSLGTNAGEDLLVWASTTESEGAKRINAILALIVELELLSSGIASEEHTFDWRGKVFTAKVKIGRGTYLERSDRQNQLADELNRRLLRYKLSPWYWVTLGDYPIFGWWSRENRPKDEDDPTEDVWFTEEDAIVAVVDLARAGLLRKIRRCNCQDWFFARFVHQKFCCVRCQQEYYRSSADYKVKRRAYMKNLRNLHKKTYLVSPKDRADKTKQPPDKHKITSSTKEAFDAISFNRRRSLG